MRYSQIAFTVVINPSSSENVQQREVENWQSKIDDFVTRRLLQNNNVDASCVVLIDPNLTKQE